MATPSWLRPLDTLGIMQAATQMALGRQQEERAARHALDQLQLQRDSLDETKRQHDAQTNLGYAGLNQRAAGQALTSQDRGLANNRIANTASGNLALGYNKLAAGQAVAALRDAQSTAKLKSLEDRFAKTFQFKQGQQADLQSDRNRKQGNFERTADRLETEALLREQRISLQDALGKTFHVGNQLVRVNKDGTSQILFASNPLKPGSLTQSQNLELNWAKQTYLEDLKAFNALPARKQTPEMRQALDRQYSDLRYSLEAMNAENQIPAAQALGLQETGISFNGTPTDELGFDPGAGWDLLQAPAGTTFDPNANTFNAPEPLPDVWNQPASASLAPYDDFGPNTDPFSTGDYSGTVLDQPPPPMTQNMLPWVPKDNRVEGELYETDKGPLVWTGEAWQQ